MNAPDLINARWRKSSHSNGSGGECVEVASVPTTVAIRDSKNPTGPAIALAPADWHRLVHQIKDDQHPPA
ncbi:DUF397 domain-containing protein [Actinomadura rupiterrae]|uniref:DUF397 domain-containing protein n=1 Tax=Actinomadura rupiterrae TaxID=559627 RepID=UPI0020A57A8B|nr:DUF397 domain-containing protein [Actinomadura rupiterrae]MCP2338619.1 hypothetical protein [Actinomadura rupiterrae]